MSSDEALLIANANGGSDFLARYPDLPVPVHRETWRPSGLPNGMYIVRLEAGGSVLTRSVHLAR